MKKESNINWHPATESPGKRRFVGAFIKKGRDEKKMTLQVMRYLSPGVLPCETHDTDRPDELCVAWTYYDELVRGITPAMITSAKAGAWAWWDEEKKEK